MHFLRRKAEALVVGEQPVSWSRSKKPSQYQVNLVLSQLIFFHVLYKDPGQLIPLFHDPYLKYILIPDKQLIFKIFNINHVNSIFLNGHIMEHADTATQACKYNPSALKAVSFRF